MSAPKKTDAPKPPYGSSYDWQRVSHEGALIGHLEKLGAVVLKSKKNETGFSHERTG